MDSAIIRTGEQIELIEQPLKDAESHAIGEFKEKTVKTVNFLELPLELYLKIAECVAREEGWAGVGNLATTCWSLCRPVLGKDEEKAGTLLLRKVRQRHEEGIIKKAIDEIQKKDCNRAIQYVQQIIAFGGQDDFKQCLVQEKINLVDETLEAFNIEYYYWAAALIQITVSLGDTGVLKGKFAEEGIDLIKTILEMCKEKNQFSGAIAEFIQCVVLLEDSDLLKNKIVEEKIDLIKIVLEAFAQGECHEIAKWSQGIIHLEGQEVLKKALIERKVDINFKASHDHSTPLMKAAYYGYGEALQLMFALGANINAMDKFGFTALDYARMKGHAKAEKAFIDAGADGKVRVKKS